jgi:hypothetical protein
MGSYSSFRIGSFEIYSVKNDIDPLLMTLFRPFEKRVFASTFGASAADRLGDGDDPHEPLTVVRYETTAGVMRDRLDLMGYSIDLARDAFERGRLRGCEDRAALYEKYRDDAILSDYADRELETLGRLTLDDWLLGFRFILENQLVRPHHLRRDLYDAGYPFPVGYMLGRSQEEFLGFPVFDSRLFLRAALEGVDPSETVSQDLTDLIAGGWFDSEDDVVAHADYLITADFSTTQRIIVLTEGSSDKRALEAVLLIRRPHLVDYFSFIDFDELRVPGGAASVINFVKAFVGAGVVNRVIAILDNDTAAKSAMRSLKGITLPSTVRIIHLPEMERLRRYPTLGPTGISETDINGLAASLELYFGEDVLSGEDGQPAPVQWRGFDDAVKQYQGEVLTKAALQERFAQKLRREREGLPSSPASDWSGIDAVLDAVCGAFTSGKPDDWETGGYW